MMSVFKIKDENGNWISIPAIKGDPGEKGEKGEDGKDAVTDQTYNPESKNAQSGKAVAEALAGISGSHGVGIETIVIDNGNLKITLTDGTILDLGNVKGADGKDGINGDNGKDGADGKDGIGVKSASINENGELIITYTEGESINLGKIIGPQGDKGDPGNDGVSGVYVGSDTMPEGYNLQIDPEGEVFSVDNTYNPESGNPQSGKAVAEAVDGGICDEKYFDITDEGIVSLKPEYRGACPSNRNTFTFAISDMGTGKSGSKNTELPKNLVIPEVVNEITVNSLADGMFMYNTVVENITIPYFITAIPDRFCDQAFNLRELYNTENISTLGIAVFQKTRLEKAKFPNLTEFLGAGAFNDCPWLKFADIGNVTTIPESTFCYCYMLTCVKGGKNVKTVGAKAFAKTHRLNNVEFLANLTSIGNYGFFSSRLNYDWHNMSGCTFGTYATAKQLNPTDIWSDCTVTACENPLPTFLTQTDTRWANKTIGDSGLKYGQSGCIMMCMIHAYCGLHNITLNSIDEWEQLANSINPDFIKSFNYYYYMIKEMVEKIGLSCERYEGYTPEVLQRLYDALAEGKYAIVTTQSGIGSSSSNLAGHALTVYGVKGNKELLLADTDVGYDNIGLPNENKLKYSKVYQNFTVQSDNNPEYDNFYVNIISLPNT